MTAKNPSVFGCDPLRSVVGGHLARVQEMREAVGRFANWMFRFRGSELGDGSRIRFTLVHCDSDLLTRRRPPQDLIPLGELQVRSDEAGSGTGLAMVADGGLRGVEEEDVLVVARDLIAAIRRLEGMGHESGCSTTTVSIDLAAFPRLVRLAGDGALRQVEQYSLLPPGVTGYCTDVPEDREWLAELETRVAGSTRGGR